MRRLLTALTGGVLIALAACETQPPSAPQVGSEDNLAPAPNGPLMSANASCSYTPAGEISVPTHETFIPSNTSDCNGAYAEITPTDGRVSLNASGSCNVFSFTTFLPTSRIKMHRCSAGGATLKIWTNSSKTTLLQTIWIDLL
jgi:hypothetical protein